MRSYENPLFNIAFNIIIPVVLLSYLPLDPTITLLIALSFPIGYGVYDRIVRKQTNWLSFIGLVSVLFTGGIGLLELDARWIAVKEAAIPLVIALFILISAFSRDPIVKALFFTESLLDVDRIAQRIEERGRAVEFERTFVIASYLLSLSFLLSTVVNYVLARFIVTAPAGTALFNEQIGRMTIVGFAAISIPMMILMVLIVVFMVNRFEKLTGLGWEELIAKHGSEPGRASSDETGDAHAEPDEDARPPARRS